MDITVMEINHVKIIESLVIIVIFVFIKIAAEKIINKTIAEKLIQKMRGEIIKKTISFLSILICLIILVLIWGINQSDLAVFVGSVLTVIGVAMFAQWSILSNITASVVIFFNHSVRIGDTIAIMENKDYEIQGKVINIGFFFITLKTSEKEEITLPNNIFVQKTIKKIVQKKDSF